MVIVRLRFLGIPVFTLEWDRDELVEEEAPAGITGGGGMLFERDLTPPVPSGEEPLRVRLPVTTA
jgi:hypothetical protein